MPEVTVFQITIARFTFVANILKLRIMAQQKSILKLQGTIGGITFYKSQDGYLAREKGGVDASRIANDASFARIRENGAEFGNSASAGKLLRDAVRVLGKDSSDGRVTARLTQIMAQIRIWTKPMPVANVALLKAYKRRKPNCF